MRFEVFGPVELRDGSGPLSGRLQRTLLAMLLIHANRPVPVDTLTEALWHGEAHARSAAKLQLHVHRLRRLLDIPDRLSFGQGGYRLRVLPEELDSARFELLTDEALEQSAQDPLRCARLLRTALDLWQGRPYEGLDIPELADEARRLADRRLTAVEELYFAELVCGRHTAVIPELTGLVRENPLRERLHSLLMTALHRAGRQAEALDVYRSARRTLVKELGLEPGPELRSVEAQVLAGEPVTFAAPRSQPPVPAQLPHLARSFVGRAAELAGLSRLLTEGEDGGSAAPLAILAGTAGVGKTALAVRWAHRVREQFPDGQLYVDLHGYSPGRPVSPEDALDGFLRALGVEGTAVPESPAERAAQFRTLVDRRRLLVVLDNACSAEQVRPLLPGTSSCFVLITSRSALTGLTAREGAYRVDLDRLPVHEAQDLLRELLGSRVDAEPGAAAQLIQRCARLPLALRIAAELIRERSARRIGDLVRELADEQERLDLLDAGDDPHASVRTVFSWSYHQLPEASARLFRLCGLHPGQDMDTHALAALAGTGPGSTRRALDQLVRASLIDASPDTHLHMHDLLGAYAAELAAAEDPEEHRRAALTRLFGHYVHTAAAAMDLVWPPEGRAPLRTPPPAVPTPVFPAYEDALSWLDTERGNLVSSAVHARFHGWPDVTVDVADVLFRYLDNRGHYDDALTLHTHALSAARLRQDRTAEAGAARHLGVVHARLGHLGPAHQHMHHAYTQYQDSGGDSWAPLQLKNLGAVCTLLGRYPEAIGYFEQALALCPGNTGSELTTRAGALNDLSQVHIHLGQYEEALALAREALALAHQLGLPAREALARLRLGAVHERLGDYPQAHHCLAGALTLAEETGSRLVKARCHPLGHVLWQLGRPEDALACVRRCVRVARGSGDKPAQTSALNALGRLQLLGERPDQALGHHAEALATARGTGERYEEAQAHAGLGAAHSALGDGPTAREHRLAALALHRALGTPEARTDARPHSPATVPATSPRSPRAAGTAGLASAGQ
ncbi:BTAD domain-containing putative transcriptional regulator [Streptomyces sp. ACA25]|uniref:AfsR/SARP family transcriptional regulator n=1 Tax=Streptomyces sp. ACA25 TaxID=3022596 RepID=UPI002306E334|nr:BTAD domain-containing putative transcriptional regulator [Streptomyces sp. ACA25]MDB1087546.1 BTAD domain-containing putative transcriptional regulator [Streptomyces sp. ACA25]